jgi:hypothetical protein
MSILTSSRITSLPHRGGQGLKLGFVPAYGRGKNTRNRTNSMMSKT